MKRKYVHNGGVSNLSDIESVPRGTILNNSNSLNEFTLIERIENIGYSLQNEKIEKIRHYYEILKETNTKYNLISRKGNWGKNIENQIINSLIIQPIIENLGPSEVLDLGSGGGFPGVPTGIIHPEIKLCLLDSSKKRTDHLSNVVNKLSMKNSTVICQRAEDLCKNEKHKKYDLVMAKAVMDPKQLAHLAWPLLKNGGIVLTYLGREKGKSLKGKVAWLEGGEDGKIRTIDLGTDQDRGIRILLMRRAGGIAIHGWRHGVHDTKDSRPLSGIQLH